MSAAERALALAERARPAGFPALVGDALEALIAHRERVAREVLARHDGPLYQTHTHLGVELNEGIRGTERRALVDLADVRGRRVLDLGCATGAELLWAVEEGAARAFGIERHGPHYFTLYELMMRLEPLHVFAFWNDLARWTPLDSCPYVRDFEADTVFAFAISHHLGYRPIWEEVPSATVAYVEGGGGSPYTAADLSRNGWTATLLGRTPGNRASFEPSRPLFRLVRDG